MSREVLNTIFAAPTKARRMRIEIPEDLAARLDALFEERGATEEQKNAVYALAIRKFFDGLDRPPRKTGKESDNA